MPHSLVALPSLPSHVLEHLSCAKARAGTQSPLRGPQARAGQAGLRPQGQGGPGQGRGTHWLSQGSSSTAWGEGGSSSTAWGEGRATATLCFPQEELEHSLGESAAQGAAGVVLWVSWESTKTKVSSGPGGRGETQAPPFYPCSPAGWPQCVPDAPPPAQESCQAIKEYVDTTLGPFVLNVTSAARLCSEALCSGHGRCARSPGHPEALLLLSRSSFSIQPSPGGGGGPLTLRGALSPEDRKRMAAEFQCHCYPGWSGAWCEQGARGAWAHPRVHTLRAT